MLFIFFDKIPIASMAKKIPFSFTNLPTKIRLKSSLENCILHSKFAEFLIKDAEFIFSMTFILLFISGIFLESLSFSPSETITI